jgi:DNA mismatch endonuclease, patch repair protein
MDHLSKDARSRLMGRIKGRNTQPEQVVRKYLFSLGFRHRLHASDLPGSPDLVFRSRRKVIFVNGCFWHGHRGCRRATLPKTNAEFWIEKIGRNRARDRRTKRLLEKSGWQVMEVWQCELAGNSWKSRLVKFLRESPDVRAKPR